MKTFVQLAESGSPMGGFKKQLGMSPADVKENLPKVGRFKKTIEIRTKIEEVKKSNLSYKDKVAEIKRLTEELYG